MRLTDEIHHIEQRMLEDEEHAENTVAVAAMAFGCFVLLGLCWAIAWVMS